MSQPREPIVKSIIEITPDDLAGATSLYEVRPNEDRNYGGWRKFELPGLSLITDRDFRKPLPNILNDSIKLNVQSSPWSDPPPASVYYVINAANEDAAVQLIQQYARSHSTFPEKFAIDTIKRHIRYIEVALLQQQHLTKSESGGRRKMKRRQIKKMKTKRRQIKKRKTTSKK